MWILQYQRKTRFRWVMYIILGRLCTFYVLRYRSVKHENVQLLLLIYLSTLMKARIKFTLTLRWWRHNDPSTLLGRNHVILSLLPRMWWVSLILGCNRSRRRKKSEIKPGMESPPGASMIQPEHATGPCSRPGSARIDHDLSFLRTQPARPRGWHKY